METKPFNFRLLTKDEVECRVATSNGKGASLLIYKTARVDYAILDETFGAMNWQIEYKEIKGNMYCGISVWDEKKQQWITKWNCGTEAKTEAEKSEASDSAKRSGFAWGIGRELYSAPFIWVNLNEDEISNGKIKPSVKFEVDVIEYDKQRNISKLVIKDSKGNIRYSFPTNYKKPKDEPKNEPKPQTENNTYGVVDDFKPKTVQQEEILTNWEMQIIANNQSLKEMMVDYCGGRKFNTMDVEMQRAISTAMKAEMRMRGIIL